MLKIVVITMIMLIKSLKYIPDIISGCPWFFIASRALKASAIRPSLVIVIININDNVTMSIITLLKIQQIV